MDLESEGSVLELMDNNEEIKNVVPDKLEITQNNGSCGVENNDSVESNNRGAEVSVSVNSPTLDMKVGLSPSSSSIRKGYGLKKWRRIKRDVNKGGESIIDTDKLVAQEPLNSRPNPRSKRMQVHTEAKQKSEGSASSSRNAVVRSIDGFAPLDDSGLAVGSSFAAGTDSENSDDRSSKSSTAASAPKLKLELPVVAGFPFDKSKIRSSSGKSSSHSVPRGHQGKGRVETNKKTRGELVKIEKENSHSSMESDLRSCNLSFVQEIFSTSNGIHTDRPMDYDKENGDEVQGILHQASKGLRVGGYDRDGEGRSDENTPEDVVVDSSWVFKDERNGTHGSSLDQDPDSESIIELQSALEALKKEVLGFKQIGEGVSVDPVSDMSSELTDIEEKSIEPNSRKSLSSRILQSVETTKKDVETELEELFKQKFEAEIKYLMISTSLQEQRVATVDLITMWEEQKALASEQNQIIGKLEDTENKAAVLKKDAERLETICEDIVTAGEALTLQKGAFKYTTCFFLQLVLFVVILGVFVVRLLPEYADIIPT